MLDELQRRNELQRQNCSWFIFPAEYKLLLLSRKSSHKWLFATGSIHI
jgi:hypothetical protein